METMIKTLITFWGLLSVVCFCVAIYYLYLGNREQGGYFGAFCGLCVVMFFINRRRLKMHKNSKDLNSKK